MDEIYFRRLLKQVADLIVIPNDDLGVAGVDCQL